MSDFNSGLEVIIDGLLALSPAHQEEFVVWDVVNSWDLLHDHFLLFVKPFDPRYAEIEKIVKRFRTDKGRASLCKSAKRYIDKVEAMVPNIDEEDEVIEGWVFFLTGLYSSLRVLAGIECAFNVAESVENFFYTLREIEGNRFMRADETGIGADNERDFYQFALGCRVKLAFLDQGIITLQTGGQLFNDDYPLDY